MTISSGNFPLFGCYNTLLDLLSSSCPSNHSFSFSLGCTTSSIWLLNVVISQGPLAPLHPLKKTNKQLFILPWLLWDLEVKAPAHCREQLPPCSSCFTSNSYHTLFGLRISVPISNPFAIILLESFLKLHFDHDLQWLFSTFIYSSNII